MISLKCQRFKLFSKISVQSVKYMNKNFDFSKYEVLLSRKVYIKLHMNSVSLINYTAVHLLHIFYYQTEDFHHTMALWNNVTITWWNLSSFHSNCHLSPMGWDSFEQINSRDISELLKSRDVKVTKNDLKEMINT